MTVYYTSADIAHRLGVAPKVTVNWVNRNILPEPEARTGRGKGLWSEEQVEDFIHFRWDWVKAHHPSLKSKPKGRREPYRPGDRPITRVHDFTERQLEIAASALGRKVS